MLAQAFRVRQPVRTRTAQWLHLTREKRCWLRSGQGSAPVGAGKTVRVVSQARADGDYLARVDEVVGCYPHQRVAQSQPGLSEKLYRAVIRDDLVDGRFRAQVQPRLASDLVGSGKDTCPVVPLASPSDAELLPAEDRMGRQTPES